MGLIMSMSLAGGSTMLLYYIMSFLFKDRWSARGRELMLMLALCFFFCPFQKIKYFLPAQISEHLPGLYGNQPGKIAYYDWSDYVLVPDGHNDYVMLKPWKVALMAAAFLVAVIFILHQMNRYFRLKRALGKCSVDMTEELSNRLAGHPVIQKIWKRKTCVLRSPAVKSPFTLGLWRPLVFLPEMDFTAEELEMVCCHELAHIKRRDAVRKAICLLAVLLHWFNPFTYLMLLEFSKVCELRCDQAVLDRLGGEKRSTYAKLIIHSAVWEGQDAGLWTSGYAGKGKDIEERVRRIMNIGRKRKRSITVVAVLLAAFCGSVSTYAYKMEQRVTDDEGIDKDEDWVMILDDSMDMDDGAIWDGDIDTAMFFGVDEPILDFSHSDTVFIADDTGENFYLDETGLETEATCEHTYVIGKIRKHDIDGRGGCTVRCYEGKCCTKCGYMLREKLLYKTDFIECPHG